MYTFFDYYHHSNDVKDEEPYWKLEVDIYNFPFSVCPSIWLIELDKLDKRLAAKVAREAFLSSNLTTLPPTTTEGR